MEVFSTSNRSGVALYLNDTHFEQLNRERKLKTKIFMGDAPVKKDTIVNVHSVGKGHVTAYVSYLKHEDHQYAEIELVYNANLASQQKVSRA